MTSPSFKTQRTFLVTIIVLYLLGNIASFFSTYGRFRASGMTPHDIFSFQENPIPAIIICMCLVHAAICIGLLRLLRLNSSYFPLLLALHYVLAIGLPIFLFLFYRQDYGSPAAMNSALAKVTGVVARDTIVLAPWIIYLVVSKKAKGIFVN